MCPFPSSPGLGADFRSVPPFAPGPIDGQIGWTNDGVDPTGVIVGGTGIVTDGNADTDQVHATSPVDPNAGFDLSVTVLHVPGNDRAKSITIGFGDPQAGPSVSFQVEFAIGNGGTNTYLATTLMAADGASDPEGGGAWITATPHVLRMTYDGTTARAFIDATQVGILSPFPTLAMPSSVFLAVHLSNVLDDLVIESMALT